MGQITGYHIIQHQHRKMIFNKYPYEKYCNLHYKDISILNYNNFKSKKCLIIATGPSTKKLLKYKDNLRTYFDVIIGVNFAQIDFEDILDFHMVMENSPSRIINYFKQNQYRKDLPRILNWMCIEKFPKDMYKVKAQRHNFNHKPNIREYDTEHGYGLFEGYTKRCGIFPGCVTIQAIHFAGILGCSKIYTIGADFVFRDEDQYYKSYRDIKHKDEMNTVVVIPKKIVEVELNNKTYTTNECYEYSANYINRFINEECNLNGVEVYDFSNGLLISATQLNIDDFFKREYYNENIRKTC